MKIGGVSGRAEGGQKVQHEREGKDLSSTSMHWILMHASSYPNGYLIAIMLPAESASLMALVIIEHLFLGF